MHFCVFAFKIQANILLAMPFCMGFWFLFNRILYLSWTVSWAVVWRSSVLVCVCLQQILMLWISTKQLKVLARTNKSSQRSSVPGLTRNWKILKQHIKPVSSVFLQFIEKIYRKTPKNSDTWKYSVIILIWIFHRERHPNDADGMANSVDPDQTAPLGAVWSGSTLFAQTCLSESLGTLRYFEFKICL